MTQVSIAASRPVKAVLVGRNMRHSERNTVVHYTEPLLITSDTMAKKTTAQE